MKKIIGLLTFCLLLSSAEAQMRWPWSQSSEQKQEQREEHRQEKKQQRAAEKTREELRDEPKPSAYEGAHLRMDRPMYNFGDVARKGGDLIHDFKLVNDGSTPLVITRVITSCSCLKASFPKKPVKAGDTAIIRITYEPNKSEPGVFHKVIQIYSNSVSGRHVITVQGNSLDPNKM